MKSSMQLRITLGMWQNMKTTTMKMRTVARLISLFTVLLLALWCDLIRRKNHFLRTIKGFNVLRGETAVH